MDAHDPDRIFVSGLPSTCTSGMQLSNAFAMVGPILESKVILDAKTGRPRGYGFVRFRYPESVELALRMDADKQHIVDGRIVTVRRCEPGGETSRAEARRSAGNRGDGTEGKEASGKEASARPRDVESGPPGSGHAAFTDTGRLPVEAAARAPGRPDDPSAESGLWVRGLPLDYDEGRLRDFFEQYGRVAECRLMPRRQTSQADLSGMLRMESAEEAQWCFENLANIKPDGFPTTLSIRRLGSGSSRTAPIEERSDSVFGGSGGSRLVQRAVREVRGRGVAETTPERIPPSTASASSTQPVPQFEGWGEQPSANPQAQSMTLPASGGAGTQELAEPGTHVLFEPCRLFVGGLPTSCETEDLALYFSAFGSVLDAQVSVDFVTGQSKGIGFVRFATQTGVELSLANDGAHFIDGKLVRVKRCELKRGEAHSIASMAPKARSAPLREPSALVPLPHDAAGIWIRGLPEDVTDDALRTLFEAFTEVVEAKVLPKRYTDTPDRAGLVRVTSDRVAKWVVNQLNGTQPPGFPHVLVCKLSTSTAPVPESRAEAFREPPGRAPASAADAMAEVPPRGSIALDMAPGATKRPAEASAAAAWKAPRLLE